MEITIKLAAAYGRRTTKLAAECGRLSTREPFIIVANEDLTLKFETTVKHDKIVVNISGNGARNAIKCTDDKLVVPREYLAAGSLEIEVAAILNGTLIRSWNVEPILLKEIDTGFAGHAEFEEIKAELTMIKEQLNNFVSAVNSAQEKTNQAITALASAVDLGKCL